ncbi:TVP38/TMEM64 family protein [Allohahella marinimesophila]|uniref:TVP38/TMEM64 family membrane protein n=1 Tax=Allohahella marinimesophila TaxID=1054972 RepID=A0ABP7PID6_9GAMM
MQRTLVKLILGILIIGLLALMWRWMSANGFLSTGAVRDMVRHLAEWRTAPWMFLAVTFVYAGLLLTMFPLSLLVVVTGLVFGPGWGLLYATLGTLASSVVSYWAGYWLGREALLGYGGRYLHGMSGYLSERGIRTMTIINLLPLAPFTLTNMMAGAFHLRFRDYMIGSTLGIVPGLAVVILLGSQLGALFNAVEREELFWALVGLAAAVVLLIILTRFTRRYMRSQAPKTPPVHTADQIRMPNEREGDSGDTVPVLQHKSRSQNGQND